MPKAERPKPNPIPKVGDGVTWGAGADSYPATIIEVSKSGLSFVFQDDSFKVVSGSFWTHDVKCEYSPNPNAERKTARWTVRRGVGAWRWDGRAIGVGHRRFYQAPEV